MGDKMAKQSRTKTLDITSKEKTWSGTKMKKQEVTELELQDCRSQMPNKQQEKMKKKRSVRACVSCKIVDLKCMQFSKAIYLKSNTINFNYICDIFHDNQCRRNFFHLLYKP